MRTIPVAAIARARAPALSAPDPNDPNRLVGTAYIKADLGGISPMTLYRIEHAPNEEERLPPPDVVLGSNKQKRWRLGTYRAWKVRMLKRGHVKLWRQGTASQEQETDA
jgi:hypothetical protein